MAWPYAPPLSGPLPAEDDLKMGHRKAVHISAVAVEADVRDMMLAARIEAAANLDAQVADGLVDR